MKKIKFQDKEWVLIGETDGAITTEENYSKGKCSYAHLFENGEIKRFGKVIGNISKIEFLGDIKLPVPDLVAQLNMLLDPSWFSRSEQ